MLLQVSREYSLKTGEALVNSGAVEVPVLVLAVVAPVPAEGGREANLDAVNHFAVDCSLKKVVPGKRFSMETDFQWIEQSCFSQCRLKHLFRWPGESQSRAFNVTISHFNGRIGFAEKCLG